MGLIQSTFQKLRNFQRDTKARVIADIHASEDVGHKQILQVETKSGGIKVKGFDTVLRVLSVSPATGQKKILPISQSRDSARKFFVFFDEDDVDFLLQVDNRASLRRHCGLLMVMNRNMAKYIVRKGSSVSLQTMDSAGNKFHFQRSLKEKELEESGEHLNLEDISDPAAAPPTSLNKPPLLGHIGLSFKYSVEKEKLEGLFGIRVKPLKRGRHIFLEVTPKDTIASIKERIEEDVGFPPLEQCLVHEGKLLESEQTLAEVNVQPGDVLNLVRRLRHYRVSQLMGNRLVQRFTFSPGGDEHPINSGSWSNKSKKKTEDPAEDFMKTRFESDETIHIEPFLLELRYREPGSNNGQLIGSWLSILENLMNYF